MENGKSISRSWGKRAPSFIFISLLILAFFCVPALAAKKAPVKAAPKTDGEASATLKKMGELYKKKDAKGLAALYSAKGVAVGIREDERLIGPAKIKEGFEKSFGELGEIRSVEIVPFSTSFLGKTAWFAARMQVTLLSGSDTVTFPGRLTGVLVKSDNKWLFSQTHLSLPGDPGKAGADALAPAVLGRIQKKVFSMLVAMDVDLGDTASHLSKTGISGDEARKAIEALCKKSPHAVDCAAVDRKGTMVIVEPQPYRKFEGADISGQEHMKRLYETSRPVFSPVFLSVEGFAAVDLERPVFSQKNELIGSASILINPETIISKAVADEKKASTFDIWAMQTDSRVIYDRNKRRTGTVLLKDDLYKPYADFVSLVERIAKEKEGQGVYRFAPRNGKAALQEASWTTITLHGTEWRLVATREAQAQRGSK